MALRDVAVIVPAAGSSSRFGGAKNKLAEELDGVAVLERAIDAFDQRKDVKWVVVPTGGELGIDLSWHRKVMFTRGGACRAESVRAALRMVPAEVEWVAVHDGARPLASQGLIDRVFAAAEEHGAAAPAMPVHLTVKEARGPLPAKSMGTVPRANLWAMQTPQVMRRVDLLEAYERCAMALDQVTDDVQLLELAGKEVWLVAGEESNLKVTSRMDLKLAELWMEEHRGGGGD